ncbi:MAG TPA: Asp-tRNA(Asn)/Glu-tRNA(Gln) amidotransferase GatCAB subunit B [Persephonella sp.]|uniref:Aspartyl/glutamyl-tRNA(Asn/Gln) amidotransferase subunit B n=1 Tax=Persephonella marina (strain DSM 14350 / EX-H1) TaxID=123214 RepID=GATB_PERMH|nr:MULTISPECIES: Asp-tRNA(Asn)/Glu-tRNA(Gln) amidotransferase subunit GatB [Persephonella]C0QUH9.1 RecName: Full=Aspartyl/glutamyl-tRNA(Asn/Gln) amidotransferase subunit B; Short=Asp/Glu-ADT subunit B [Persephonella marina EX-H1]ACO03728.1 aspartyl/glutamyl-tRNA(Asn/Gln) amidotransferase subunit B (Asp/Glu-ADT subunit B) [Persephonella marina EX-H1]HCB70039.1 Asp-tRNA(Asn)/Glu-tRNA(Gln) amidotransferase GatCAB subunit B [Persephonella sp.]
MEFEPVIGLEVHVQMSTNTKCFCSCKIEFGAEPNTNVCPVCLGMPGSLPVLNKKALEYAIKASLALNCEVHELSVFARKNYFYPDLPKGYQISQYDKPLATNGYIDIKVNDKTERIRIHRLHMEEDAGKTIHKGSYSYVDLNRAGTPLMEIVSEPDIRSAVGARLYLEKLRNIMRYIGVSDADMEKGQLRCDVNISLRPKGEEKFGTKVEIKNINSFRFVQKAIEYEIERQARILRKGGEIVQETRLFDEKTGKTFTMRTKEEAHDYRYFPDPDLIPVRITKEYIEEIRKSLPELPDQKAERYVKELKLTEYDAEVLVADKDRALFFEKAVSVYSENPKSIANWIINELLGKLNEEGIEISNSPVRPEHIAELVQLIDKGDISSKIGKEVFEEVFKTGKSPKTIVEEKGLKQVSDEGEIRKIVEEVLNNHPAEVEKYKAGNQKLMGFFVGQVMKATRGKANPKLVNKILQELLK